MDTYDTLESGIPNAIKVAKEMEKDGNKLIGIRLDSGDLADLAVEARKMLNEAGLNYVKIIASDQLDEYVIRDLNKKNAPIDGFGVGTELITGKKAAALDGVYKLSMYNNVPRLKISETREKITLPGIKKLYRLHDGNQFIADVIALEEEDNITALYDIAGEKVPDFSSAKKENIRKAIMKNGKIAIDLPGISDSADYARDRLERLSPVYKKPEVVTSYPVTISEKLRDLRSELVKKKQ